MLFQALQTLSMLLAFSLLVACGQKPVLPAPPPQISAEATDVLALCAGGVSNASAIGAKIIANINGRAGGQLTAEAENSLRTEAVQSGIFSDTPRFTLYLACVDSKYRPKIYPPIPPVANNSHRGQAVAYKVSDGIYALKSDLIAGDCKISSGSQLDFQSDSTVTMTSKVQTNGLIGDYFHSYVAVGTSIIVTEITSERISLSDGIVPFNRTAKYLGPKPTQDSIVWIGDC